MYEGKLSPRKTFKHITRNILVKLTKVKNSQYVTFKIINGDTERFARGDVPNTLGEREFRVLFRPVS